MENKHWPRGSGSGVFYGWEGNRRSDVALAIHQDWHIHP